MRHFVRLSLSLFLVLCVVGLMNAQTARIIVKGVSPDIQAAGLYNAVSSGLPNVGKGTKVWLEAEVIYSGYLDTIISQSWSTVPPPGGFAQALHNDTTTYLIPDTTGQYLVTVNITSNHGSSAASVYINSADWVGTGSFAGTPSGAQCALGCHSDKITTWQSTPHARIFAYGVDSISSYSTRCLSCHTVGYNTSPAAVNGGWDDVALANGFVLPRSHPGVWDSIKTNFPAVANLSNIQCENCHGPGSLHMGDTSKNKIAVTLSADACTQCHGAAPHHSKGFEWNNSVHSNSLAEGTTIEAMNRSSCARCHTANGYLNETIDGNPSAAPYANVQPVSCAACHDPHDVSNPKQLRSASIAAACDGCHITRLSSHGLHHSHQSPMLTGSKGTPWPGVTSGVGNWGGAQFAGFDYPNSSHSNITDRCSTCHMAESAGGADTSMVPAPYSKWRGQLGGHTFRVFWDAGTPSDSTDDLINPFGCAECHGTVSLNFVRQSQDPIKALLEQLRVLLPHNTTGDTTLPLGPASAGLSPIQKAASYNWYFVENDGSFGVHNNAYASALLQSSIDMVNLGAGAASIASVLDVPNDEGKQVQVVWDKFPAESYPVDPVVNYLVLRQDSAGAAAAKIGDKPLTATSFRDMLGKVARGVRVVLSGSVWTKVGEFHAINQPRYSLNVPTLYDSTIVGGLKLTTFDVVGYTAKNVVYASAPMSGYSVDNLAPAPPANVSAHSGVGVAILAWDKSAAADFKYFAVYRSTTPGVSTSGTPLASTSSPQYSDAAVVSGTVYYYKITAFDFSGNQSNASNEVSLLVTEVGEGAGIPTEYALRQNSPNPFNPTTRIAYDLPQAAHVSIQIYNTLGMKVATIVDHDQPAGYYSIVWNGRDNQGASVASGIYIYKMEAGNYTSVKKMMLIK